MERGLHCSPQSSTFTVNVDEDPKDRSLKVHIVGTELILENVLSSTIVYLIQFKAQPDSQPSTSRSSSHRKHSINPREAATGFLLSNTSRSVRVVRDGGGQDDPNVPSRLDRSLEVLWCISVTSEGDEQRRKQILNEERSKGNLKIISIDAIRSSATPRSTASLQPSQTQTLYVEPSRWKSGECISFTLTNPIDGEQHPAYFASVEPNSTGGGGYTDVWKCNIAVQGAERPSSFVAVRSLRMLHYESIFFNKKLIKVPRAREELEIWRRLRHPYIAPLLGNFNSSAPCYITIWYEYGTLFDCISPEPINKDRVRILKELTEGLQYLHSNGIIHGDIHNESVLAREDGAGFIHPVFIDFGLSKMLEDSYNQTFMMASIRQKGRVINMAPELLHYSSPPRHKPSDVYAFALLLLEVASGKTAFSSEQEYIPLQILYERIAAGSVKPDQSRFTFISTAFWNLLSECWATESTSRPSIEDISGRLGAMRGMDFYQREE